MSRRSRLNQPLGTVDANRTYSLTALPTNAGARTRYFDPARCSYNFKPSNSTNVRTVLATSLANSGLAGIVFEGDSKVAGTGTNSGASINSPLSMPGRVLNLLGSRGYTIAGTGFCPAAVNQSTPNAGDTRWTFTGTWGTTGVSSNFASTAASGAAATFASNRAGTVVEVYSFSNSAPMTISIDGATPANGSVTVQNGTYSGGTFTPSGTSVISIATITGLSNATHNVVLTSTSATTTYVLGVNVRGTTGLQVHNIGIPSSTSANWNNSAFYQSKNVSQSLPGTVVFIALGVNDAKASVTIANYKTAIQALITGHAAGGRDVILVVPSPPRTTQVTQALWDTYVYALYDLADSNDIPLVDLTAAYQSWTIANGKGLMYDDLHENELGYAVDAGVMLGAIAA